MEDTYENAYVEILEILNYVPTKEREKIPKAEIDFFEKNKNVEYQYNYNPENPTTLRKTDAIIVNLYKKYLATAEENKKIDEMLFLNEQKSEIKKRQLYRNKIIFENKKDEIKAANLPAEIKEESLIEKIISKIKNFLKIRKSRRRKE